MMDPNGDPILSYDIELRARHRYIEEATGVVWGLRNKVPVQDSSVEQLLNFGSTRDDFLTSLKKINGKKVFCGPDGISQAAIYQ